MFDAVNEVKCVRYLSNVDNCYVSFVDLFKHLTYNELKGNIYRPLFEGTRFAVTQEEMFSY